MTDELRNGYKMDHRPKSIAHRYMSDTSSDEEENPKKFIQAVMSSPSYREGAMTRKAAKHGMTALEYAKKVLEEPDKHNITTRRQAQFLVNIQRKKN